MMPGMSTNLRIALALAFTSLACGSADPAAADASSAATTTTQADPTTSTSLPAAGSSGPSLDTSSSTSAAVDDSGSSGEPPVTGALDIYWIDVEGGAATLLITPTGQHILVDTGFPGDRDADRIATTLAELGSDRIELCIITHYHVDHVGGVPALAERVTIDAFWDHGDSVEAGNPDGQQLFSDYLAVADGRRTIVSVGQSYEVGGLQLDVVSAAGQVQTTPLPGASADNPACASAPQMQSGYDENAMSVGFVARFGSFDFLDLGDLTWSYEAQLACPMPIVDPIDLHQISHHGLGLSGAPQLLEAIDPPVAVMNNGPHKGGDAATFDRLFALSDPPDLWQVHRAAGNDDAHNTESDLIANLGEGDDDDAVVLHAHIDADGLVTLTNPRTSVTRQYASL